MDAIGRVCKSCKLGLHQECVNPLLGPDYEYGPCTCTHRVLDAALGVALRDIAMEQVDEHADQEWKEAADAAMYLCCRKYEYLTTTPPKQLVAKTREERAWSGVIIRAKSKGWIEATDEWEKTEEPQAHRRDKRVWHSLIWEGRCEGPRRA